MTESLIKNNFLVSMCYRNKRVRNFQKLKNIIINQSNINTKLYHRKFTKNQLYDMAIFNFFFS